MNPAAGARGSHMRKPGMRRHCVGALVLLCAAFSLERVSLGRVEGSKEITIRKR